MTPRAWIGLVQHPQSRRRGMRRKMTSRPSRSCHEWKELDAVNPSQMNCPSDHRRPPGHSWLFQCPQARPNSHRSRYLGVSAATKDSLCGNHLGGAHNHSGAAYCRPLWEDDPQPARRSHQAYPREGGLRGRLAEPRRSRRFNADADADDPNRFKRNKVYDARRLDPTRQQAKPRYASTRVPTRGAISRSKLAGRKNPPASIRPV